MQGRRALQARRRAPLASGVFPLADQVAGFDAGKDAFGRAIPGWSRSALPVATGKPPGQAYADVKQRKPR